LISSAKIKNVSEKYEIMGGNHDSGGKRRKKGGKDKFEAYTIMVGEII